MNGSSSYDLSDSMSGSMSQSVSSLPINLIRKDFSLANKRFRNGECRQSFLLIKKLYSQAFINYQKEIIDETLFRKIVNLYFTEIGLYCEPENKYNFSFNKVEQEEIFFDLKQQSDLDRLIEVYSNDINLIPSNIILNLSLVYCVVSKVTANQKFSYEQLGSIYNRLNFDGGNRSLHQFVELYVFRVLAETEKYDEAAHVIRSNVYFADSVESSLGKLNLIKKEQVESKKLAANQLKEKENEQKRRETEEKKRNKENKDLRFRNLKDVRQLTSQNNNTGNGSNSIFNRDSHDENQSSVNYLLQKVLYTYNLSKSFISENSPVLLVAVILALIATRFIRTRRINLKEKLKETITMAFRISYL